MSPDRRRAETARAPSNEPSRLCILVSPTDSTKYVGKNFSVPGRGRCKTWNGVYLPSFAPVSVSSGTACTASDGGRINLGKSRENVAFNDYIVLPLPDLSNGTLSEIVPQFGNNPLIVTGISAAKCKPKDNPIPWIEGRAGLPGDRPAT